MTIELKQAIQDLCEKRIRGNMMRAACKDQPNDLPMAPV